MKMTSKEQDTCREVRERLRSQFQDPAIMKLLSGYSHTKQMCLVVMALNDLASMTTGMMLERDNS